jgi:predicted MFS family arabinose efflux permease
MPRWNAYAGFAVFGAFWGAWGASLPAVRDQAAVSDGELGTALLFIGAGALPAMLLAGRAVDRWHERAMAALLALLGAVGVLVVLSAHGVAALAVTLVLLGATSGAVDVAINTVAGSAQRAHRGPVIPRAHATFSAAVVIASLTTGALLAAGLPIAIPFAGVAAAALAVAVAILRAGSDARRRRAAAEGAASPPDRADPPPDRAASLRAAGVRVAPLLLIGGLGALAFAVENAHQSWSALYLSDVVGAGAATASAGPAVFAGVVAVTRFATGAASGERPRLVLVGGAIVAALGTALVAATSTLAVALAGFALAAAGTAVLFPTLMVVLTARVPEPVRGAATSMVTTVAYLGFLAGPVYVGGWADAVGLPGAMLAVAALAALLAMLAATSVRARVAAPR